MTADLPLLSPTPRRWAEIAARDLDAFLADHAVCEQQAALTALNLLAHYPEDDDLVQRMGALAAEEVSHLRRVATLLRRRGGRPARRRPNPYVAALRRRVEADAEPALKVDRLLVAALIEARSCERFTLLLDTLGDDEDDVRGLLADLGPAERRHWEMFHALAARDADAAWFADRWRAWLEHESSVSAALGNAPRVHG